MDKNKSKEKLYKVVEEEVTKLFESALDYAQVACSNPETYKVLRSKILRVGNNCIRAFKNKLELYDVIYKIASEDVIEIKSKK